MTEHIKDDEDREKDDTVTEKKLYKGIVILPMSGGERRLLMYIMAFGKGNTQRWEKLTAASISRLISKRLLMNERVVRRDLASLVRRGWVYKNTSLSGAPAFGITKDFGRLCLQEIQDDQVRMWLADPIFDDVFPITPLEVEAIRALKDPRSGKSREQVQRAARKLRDEKIRVQALIEAVAKAGLPKKRRKDVPDIRDYRRN